MPMKNRFADLHPEMTEWRRWLHRNPELLFDLPKTSAFVAEKLRDFGCDEVVTGIAGTGVVAVIRGRQTASGRVVGLRADMDALPIEERTGRDYASETPGKMHACGHDGHTTMLLGAAKYLAETRNFDGTAVLVFQPAEEGGGGGRVMVEEGLMKRFGIEEIYGMHNVPGRALGTFAIREGAFYAATAQFDIIVRGRGGHAAQPHTTVDSTLVASQIVVALQAIAAREVDPVKQAVVSVTSFETATTAYNVIPASVALKGTARVLDKDVHDLVERRIGEIARGVAAAHGAEADVEYRRGYPVLMNSGPETEHAAEAARRVTGGCAEAPIYMWGEDFGFMLNAAKGAYIHLGIGEAAALHHPEYDFNDEALPVGSAWFAEMVEMRMPAG